MILDHHRMIHLNLKIYGLVITLRGDQKMVGLWLVDHQEVIKKMEFDLGLIPRRDQTGIMVFGFDPAEGIKQIFGGIFGLIPLRDQTDIMAFRFDPTEGSNG